MQFSKTTFIKLFVTLGYAFVGYSHRFGRRTCHTVGELVQNQPYMDGHPPAVFISRPVAQKVDKLALHHGKNEVKRRVRVAHNEEQGRFFIPDDVKLQLVILHQLPHFPDVKWR